MIFIFLLLVLLAGLVFAWRFYGSSHLSPRLRWSLLILRTLIIIVIIIAFIQPRFTIKRFQPDRQKIAVLIDNSASMSLFKSDSIVRFLTIASSKKVYNSAKTRTTFFLFGDSIRLFSTPKPGFFSDNYSRFPNSFYGSSIDEASSILLISDGNWESAPPYDLFKNHRVYYLELNGFTSHPYCRVTIDASSTPALVGSTDTIKCRIEGFSQGKANRRLLLSDAGRRIASANILPDSGYFSDTAEFIYTPLSAGGHLLRCSIIDDSTTTLATAAILRTVVPKIIRLSFCSRKPSLNRRFFTLAAEGLPGFIRGADNDTSADALICFDNESFMLHTSLASKSKTVACIGTLPCSAAPDTSLISGPALFLNPDFIPDRAFTASRLPPNKILHCLDKKNKPARIHLWSFSSNSRDTLPIVWETMVFDRRIIVCSLVDIWIWDFLPAGFGAANPYTFSRTILTLIREQAIASASSKFLLYPIKFPITNLDSIRLQTVIPASCMIGDQYETNIAIYDSANNQVNGYGKSGRINPYDNDPITLPPIPTGRYRLAGSLRCNQNIWQFSDSIVINNNDFELQILGQNNPILRQYAQQISADSLTYFFGDTSKPGADILKTTEISIHRTWILLVLLLGLIIAELIIRKRASLS